MEKTGELFLFGMALFVAFALGLWMGSRDHDRFRQRMIECEKDLRIFQYGEP